MSNNTVNRSSAEWKANSFRKTFSSFSDVCFAVKSSQRKTFVFFTRKTLTKFRKTVYGKIFRKPFSFQNTREALLCSLSLFSFSASSLCLCSLLSAQPPRAIPATPIRSGRVASGSFRARPAARSDSRTRVRAISSRRVSFNRISRGRRRWRPFSTHLGTLC
jgi:hypothetical protein